MMISWMGPEGNITTISSGNTYTSSLRFNKLWAKDEGTYTCNVMIVDTNKSQSVEIQPITSKL